MPRPSTFSKFRDVQAELARSGSAIFRDAQGNESLVLKDPYAIEYIHSYAEDSPFFLALAEGRLLGSACTGKGCGYRYATPRSHCMECGSPTKWFDLPKRGTLHSWTTCHFGSEAFLAETPYNLALVQFEGVGSVFLVRLRDCVESEIYVGMPVVAKFTDKPRYRITDVWFVPDRAKA